MRRALYAYKITGVKTSIRFLERIMESADFRQGKYNTHFIEKNLKFLTDERVCDDLCEDVAIMAVKWQAYLSRQGGLSFSSYGYHVVIYGRNMVEEEVYYVYKTIL